MSNSYKFYSDTKDIMKKYVNATEGAIIYGISKSRMHCRFFWGHNNRCANGTCCKPSKKTEQKLPTECVGCPYYQGNGYCFPCMRKLIGK